MPEPEILILPTQHGNSHIGAGRVEHWGCNAEIGRQAARDLGLVAEILAIDRLRIHPPSRAWDWEDYHFHYIELLIENGLA
jgi:hypothetical protein